MDATLLIFPWSLGKVLSWNSKRATRKPTLCLGHLALSPLGWFPYRVLKVLSSFCYFYLLGNLVITRKGAKEELQVGCGRGHKSHQNGLSTEQMPFPCAPHIRYLTHCYEDSENGFWKSNLLKGRNEC